LTAADLRRLVERLGVTLAPSTVTGILDMLSALLRFAKKAGLVERNVVRDLDRDPPLQPRRPGESRRRSGCTGETSASAPRRSGSCPTRRRRHVREDTKTSASTATVPLLPGLERELCEHRARLAGVDLRRVRDDQLVFTRSRGKPQSRRNALRTLQRAAARVGLNPEGSEPVGPHDLRHSFVGLGLNDGTLTVAEASVLARPANAKVTAQIYAGLSDQAKSQLAAKLTSGLEAGNRAVRVDVGRAGDVGRDRVRPPLG
jgi:hypothetical protein